MPDDGELNTGRRFQVSTLCRLRFLDYRDAPQLPRTERLLHVGSASRFRAPARMSERPFIVHLASTYSAVLDDRS